jgi:hypothetical protein
MRWVGWLQLPLLLLWVMRPRLALLGFLLVLTPINCIVGELQTRTILSRAEQPSPYDLAGRYAHQALTPAQRASLSIAGAEVPGIYRAMFHVDQRDVGMVRLQPGAPLDLTQAPAIATGCWWWASTRCPPSWPCKAVAPAIACCACRRAASCCTP